MKPAIITRAVHGKNFYFKKNEGVYIAQWGAITSLVRIDKDSNIEYPVATAALNILSKEVKVEIHEPRLPRRNDSMFYFRKHIATISKGHKKIIVESSGEMQAAFKMNSDSLQNEQLAKELKKRGTTDRGLSTMGSNDLIQMNNWFRLWVEENGVYQEEEIAHTYDDAIALAKQIINED